jgi:histidinol-phosphate phosphatase family protein
MLHLEEVNNSWTLFLDRDGVINHEKDEDYIRNWDEFIFYPESLEALPLLAKHFHRIILVTNQKGIGKQLMTTADLDNIHRRMLTDITTAGGRIDRIYYCPDLDNNSPNRKPQPGMAFQAKKDFPEIEFNKSIMIGNRLSDMHFGRNAAMHTVFLATTHPEVPYPDPLIDLKVNTLLEFAHLL